MTKPFKKLTVYGWRQFDEVEIDFHRTLTVITGSNGAGKSTLLSILRSHLKFQDTVQYLATPVSGSAGTQYSSGNWLVDGLAKLFSWKKRAKRDEKIVGRVVSADGSECSLSVDDSQTIQYQLTKSNDFEVSGLYISSHRQLPRYERIQALPIAGMRPEETLFDYYENQKAYENTSMRIRFGVHTRASAVSSIKEGLIGFATFGVGNRHMAAMPELVGMFEAFENILNIIFPEEIGFQKLEIKPPEVVFITKSGNFPLDGLSGGLMSMLQIAWQIFLHSRTSDKDFAVVLDEPENH